MLLASISSPVVFQISGNAGFVIPGQSTENTLSNSRRPARSSSRIQLTGDKGSAPVRIGGEGLAVSPWTVANANDGPQLTSTPPTFSPLTISDLRCRGRAH